MSSVPKDIVFQCYILETHIQSSIHDWEENDMWFASRDEAMIVFGQKCEDGIADQLYVRKLTFMTGGLIIEECIVAYDKDDM